MIVKTAEQLKALIIESGFLPLFDGSVPGFSVEAVTDRRGWWSGDEAIDPWSWRMSIAAEGDIIYGKFLEKKSAFFSREWFPVLANYRRGGYDFDALYEDGRAGRREKNIMELFTEPQTSLASYKIRKMAGFGAGGDKGFEGTLGGLQMKTYLVVGGFDFKRKRNGETYGWPVSFYRTAESALNADFMDNEYRVEPKESFEKLVERMKKLCPQAGDKSIRSFLK